MAPEGAAKLRLETQPTVDWDTFICSGDGKMIGIGANIFGNPCDNALGQERVPLGCAETAEAEVVPGERYTMLALNFSDFLPLPGTYVFLAE